MKRFLFLTLFTVANLQAEDVLITIPLKNREIAQISEHEIDKETYLIKFMKEELVTDVYEVNVHQFNEFLKQDAEFLNYLKGTSLGWAGWSTATTFLFVAAFVVAPEKAPKSIGVVLQYVQNKNMKFKTKVSGTQFYKWLSRRICGTYLLYLPEIILSAYKIGDLAFAAFLIAYSYDQLSDTQIVYRAFSQAEHDESMSKKDFIAKLEEFQNADKKSFKNWIKGMFKDE